MIMKVLWFTNHPCGSLRRGNDKIILGGWLPSLEEALKVHENIELHVAYISRKKEEPFAFEGVNYFPMCEDIGIGNPVVRIIKRHQGIEAKNNRLLHLLQQAVEFTHPDLIHIHGTEERFGLIADYIKDIPIVFSIQGLIAPITEKYWSGIPQNVVNKSTSLLDCFRGISHIKSFFDFKQKAKRELHYLENAKYIIGRTYWDKRVTLLCNPKRIYYQGEELMRPDFYRTQWQKPDDIIFRIVTTSSGSSFKGFETALQAAYILKQFAKFEFEWYIIGVDRSDSWIRISEKYKHLKSENVNIKLCGKLDSSELKEILLSSNLYCQVSHIENSPNSLCEALLLGMPTIASFAGGTVSLTKGDERESVLYQDGDPFALAGSIVDVQSNYDSYIEKGKLARKTALFRHDPKRVASEYLNIYKDILERNNK